MTTRDHLFLLVYDRTTGTLTVDDLGHDVDAAMRTYSEREREFDGWVDVEVVLLGAPSLEALKRTHSSYFGVGDHLPVLPGSGRDS
jgi:hypothetical protein